MNTYIAFYNNKEVEIKAETLYEAKQKAIAELKVSKSKQGLLAVMVAEIDGKEVIHSTAGIG